MLKIYLRVAFTLVSIFLLALASFGIVLNKYFDEYSLTNITILEETMVEIPRASSLKKVCEILKEKNIILDEQKFYWYLRLGRSDSAKVQAGYYKFKGKIANSNIANRLLRGHKQSIRITIKEGDNLVQIAQNLHDQGLVSKDKFINAMTNKRILSKISAPNVDKRKFLENDMGGIEGYLFPDTYFFSVDENPEQIILTMHKRLISLIDNAMYKRMSEMNLSLHEVLALASIIEKETGDESERPIISSVYQNRIKIGMRLQADPTVIYGIKNYDGKIRKKDLLAYHPYNTYKIKALPPGPIASPGLEAIRSVLWPEPSDALYFVSKNDGSHVFCPDLKCHNKAVKKWQVDFFKAARK